MAVFRSNVMSRKSTTFFVGFNSDLQVAVLEDFAHFFLLSFLLVWVFFVQVASPLSLYNPVVDVKTGKLSRNSPARSQVSAPSKLPSVNFLKRRTFIAFDIIISIHPCYY